MSHGAAKKVDSIPYQAIVNIYAWEGLLQEAMQNLAQCLKAVFEGDETLWEELTALRLKVVQYNQEYTKAIMRLTYSQNRG